MIPDPKAAKAVLEHSSKVITEFKAFISKGNVIDLAVGVIIGAAFGKIVTALVNDIIMPPISLLSKGVDFKDLYIPLDGKKYATLADAKKASAAILPYGDFINTVFEFFIIAACIFFLVKVVTAMRLSQTATPVAPTKSEVLLTEIRDLLQQKNSN
jgi:large conductance mechanosensitive channel